MTTFRVEIGPPQPDLRRLLGPGSPSLLIESDPDTGHRVALAGSEPLTLRVATSPVARVAVERETRMLVELRRRRLGAVEATIPRYVATRYLEGLPAVVSSTPPGRSMAVDLRQWMHTARPDLVRRDFRLAGSWLAAFQDASSTTPAVTVWVSEVREVLQRRWLGHPALPNALDRLARAARNLDGTLLEQTAVHGQLGYERLLIDADRVSGVVDWSSGELEGSPLRDLGRFVVDYSAALHLGTGPGDLVVGHRGLRRTGALPGLRYTLLGRTWYTRLVRDFLAEGLERIGLPAGCAGAVIATAIGEVAATTLAQPAAVDHLTALAALPA